MNFKITISLLTVCCTTMALPDSRPTYSVKVKFFFNNQELSRPCVYIVKNRPYSALDAGKKLNILGKFGFKWNEIKNEDGKVAYLNNEEKRFLVYNEKKRQYRYSNRLLRGLSANDTLDKIILRKKADEILNAIVDGGTQKYQFINEEYEYVVYRDEGEKKLDYITYRYVLKLDNRPVMGTTNCVRITLGNGIQMKECVINDAIIEKKKDIERKIKRNAIEPMIAADIKSDKHIKDSNGQIIPIEKTDVIGITESYVCKNSNNERVLTPHVTFFTVELLSSGDLLRRENHFSIDANDVANTLSDDIIEYDQNSK